MVQSFRLVWYDPHILLMQFQSNLSTGITILVRNVSLFFTYRNGYIGIIHFYTNITFIHCKEEHGVLTPSGYLKPLQLLCVDKSHNFKPSEIHLSQFLRFGLSQYWRASQNLLPWNIVTICRIFFRQSCFIKAGTSSTQKPPAFKVYRLLFLFHEADLEMYLQLFFLSPSVIALKSLLCLPAWYSSVIICVLISISERLTCMLKDRTKKLHS